MSNSRSIPRACLFIGAFGIVAGLVMTIFSAYMVTQQTDAAPQNPDSAAMAAMGTFYHSMNHFAAISVAVTVLGMAFFLGGSLALSRNRKQK